MEKPPSEDQDFSERKDQDSSTAMAEEEEPGKIEYPPEKSCYKILDDIGKGENAIVHKAACLPMNSSIVAIKAINVDRSRVDLKRVISHPNILQAHRSFMVDSRLLWVVMPFISSGSLESIIASSFPDGLSEPCIAIVLKEILKALLYLHEQGHLHRDIKASNILIDSDGSVKLSDFGVSASIYKPNSSQTSSSSSPSLSSLSLKDVAETPFWMAPEVIESHTGYSFKTDIWSFGITALELAHGRPPLSHFPLSKSLIMSVTHRFRFFDYEKNRKDKKNFSESFKDLVISCLIADPSKRPNAEELLKHPFFKNCKNADFLVENILQDLPTIEERFKKTKQIPPPPTRNDEEENPEEGSPEVKQRRISGWKFNEEDMEFEPVFPAEKGESSSKTQEEESITKRVRFGGEVIIHEFSDKDDEDPSPPIPEEHTILLSDEAQSLIEQWANEEDFESEETGSPTNIDEPEIGGHDDAGLQNPIPQQVAQGMIPSLEVLQFSLNAQLLAVSNMLAQIRGEVVEVTSEEQLLLIVQQLRVELDRERSKASALEMHLESIRRSTGLTDGSSDTTSSSGHGSSSE